MVGELKNRILNNLRNIPGWNSNRKIVVFESDDWGAIRMPSKKIFDKLKNKGLPVDKSSYNTYDSLESNHDLEALFEVLSKYKDKIGKHPIFTALTIVGNPNFSEIAKSNFENYSYEPMTSTLEQYGNSHNKVMQLYKEGLEGALFYPEFHGREHINVKRWMSAIQEKNSVSRISFENKFYGLGAGNQGSLGKNHFAAFDIDTIKDLEGQQKIITDGLQLFNELFGYKSQYFVPPNFLYNSNLEFFLFKNHIKLLPGSRIHKEPMGEGKTKKSIRYTGLKNHIGQTFLVRNVQFEPSQSNNRNEWKKAIKEVKAAFFWKKPVIISTHRLNYIGYINEENRKRGLKQLDLLIKNLITEWPDVEFMTSAQLAEIMNN